MKKEIKFRGKAVGRDIWVYGYYHTAPLTIENFGIGHLPTPDGKPIHCISTRFGVTWQVDEQTIGQYTGHNDKNNKEIYEEDIVEWFSNNGKICMRMAVDWRKDETGYKPRGISNGNTLVIGNIHDNPELLNEKK